MASTIVGLDIGNGVIRAAELADANKPRPTLVRYHSIAVPASAVQRGEVVEQNTVASALKQLWSQGGFKSKDVVLGMGNPRVLVRDVSVPKMPLNMINESLPFQVQDMLPVPVSEAILDFYPIATGRSDSGEVINGLLVAAIKDAVLKNVETVRSAGLTPVEVDLIPFALTRLLVSARNAVGTVALVHIGAVTSLVVIAVNGVPNFVRIIQNGSEDVTSALVANLGIDASQADEFKRGFGLRNDTAGPEWRPVLVEIMRSTGALIDNIRNTLSFFVHSHPGVAIDRLIVSGGGAMLGGLPEAISEATRLPVSMPDPLDALQIAKSADADRLRIERSGVAVAAGLAMGVRA